MTTPREYTDVSEPSTIPADQMAPVPEDHTPPPPADHAPAQQHAETQRSAQPGSGDAHSSDGLFAADHLSQLRSQWNDVQASFVDDPRDCVQKADRLVSSAVEQLTANFSQTRSQLEEQWQRGEDASTEDLRVALRRYRDFFDRLLAV